jgi:ubiquinone/menaquinone biosynthesis C-methylase UbiE
MAEGAKGTLADVYVLTTGDAAADRLRLLDQVYGPTTREKLLQAGLCAETRGLDLACGVGVVSCFMASVIGKNGSLVAADVNPDQLVVAKGHCAKCEHDPPIDYIETSAYEIGLPSESFDLVHIRLLLCHLVNPVRALREVYRLLKPGGALVCQDLRVSSVFCAPDPSVFARVEEIARAGGKALGVDYNYGVRMAADAEEVGFQVREVWFNQPVYRHGPEKRLWEHTFREALPSIVRSGVATESEINSLLEEMRLAAEDERNMIAQWGMPGMIAVK